ncbi:MULTISPECIES: DMT family transporter [unclassified Roseovarius]|jgi:transporter family-2 protein|uniref:DMT family transporter n=1 Tax=unclassified Roseovarius TaxID=2614913 RepID=UPI0000685B34|nr:MULTISPECIES: DMT family transporter [unclassified Roseovarius]EAQ26923.1 amidophosphoribosyltransferase [Roseovarius sp. 217]KJS42086.1 MAG: amidophosphoribosyltransferase [Roseovarius sp. BRH_c41]
MLPQSPVFALILMAVAGLAIAIQAPLNAALGRTIESSVAAAAVSFGVGFVALVLLVALSGDSAAFGRAALAPLWLLLGGLLGAFFVWASLWSVPVLGVLTTTAALILGQIVGAMVLDYIGAFGIAARDLSLTRVMAALLVGAGVILSRF